MYEVVISFQERLFRQKYHSKPLLNPGAKYMYLLAPVVSLRSTPDRSRFKPWPETGHCVLFLGKTPGI